MKRFFKKNAVKGVALVFMALALTMTHPQTVAAAPATASPTTKAAPTGGGQVEDLSVLGLKAAGWTCVPSGSSCTNPNQNPSGTLASQKGGYASCSTLTSGIGSGGATFLCTIYDKKGGTEIGSGGSIVGAAAPITVACGAPGGQPCQAQVGTSGSCDIAHLGDCITGAALGVAALIGFAILSVMGWFLGGVGVLFNFVLLKTVFQFATSIGNAPGLLIAWGILRDVGNIFLLFGFIFMGVLTILDVGSYTATKALPRLIIFAVLLNFSLFAAQGVIDVANALSSVLSTQSGFQCASAESNDQCVSRGLAGQVINASGLSTIFNIANGDAKATLSSFSDNPVRQTITVVMLALFVTVVAIVLMIASFLLISRAVILVFLMVTAPIGFAGMAVPFLGKQAKQWWDELLCQSFFAPVFLLMMFISLKVMEGVTKGAGSPNLAAAVTADDYSSMGVFLIFALIIGFMVASLIAAKQFSCMGSATAMKMGGKAAGTLMFGVGAFGARHTVGAAARAAAERARKSGWARNGIGRMVVGGLDTAAKGNYDLRSTKAVAGAAKFAGTDLGTAQKGGYKKIHDDQTKAKVAYAKTLGQTDEESKAQKALEYEKESRTEKFEDTKKKHEEALKENASQHDEVIASEKEKNKENSDSRKQERDEKRKKIERFEEQAMAAAARGNTPDARREARAAKDAADAERSSLATLTTEHEELTKAEAEYVDALKQNRAFDQNKLKEEQKSVETAHKEFMKGNVGKGIEGVDDRITNLKQAPQAEYANSLDRKDKGLGRFVNRTVSSVTGPAGRSSNIEAAKKILREVKKTDADKLREALEANMNKPAEEKK